MNLQNKCIVSFRSIKSLKNCTETIYIYIYFSKYRACKAVLLEINCFVPAVPFVTPFDRWIYNEPTDHSRALIGVYQVASVSNNGYRSAKNLRQIGCMLLADTGITRRNAAECVPQYCWHLRAAKKYRQNSRRIVASGFRGKYSTALAV